MGEPLDLKGLKCPLPVLRAKKALKGMAPGAVLEVSGDGPRFGQRLSRILRDNRRRDGVLVRADGVFTYSLRKKS